MRPRSKLLSKRRILPTIREGTEEMLRDLNDANTLHTSSGHCHSLSSEDYLLSICHLAHPTFPCWNASFDNINACQADAVHQRLQPSRLGKSTSATFEEAPTDNGQGRESRQLGGDLFGYHGNSDPLEYLYGHQSNLALSPCLSGSARRAFVERRIMRQNGGAGEGQARSRAKSVPCTPGPDQPCQRKSSCPELHTSTHTTYEDASTKHCLSKLEAGRGNTADRGSEGEKHIPTIKHPLISQWIYDCKSAWREARVRVCLLPAIAEI